MFEIGSGVKKALVVVDYQNDFVSGSLGFPKAEKIYEAICRKIEYYVLQGFDVIFTLDTHHDNYLDTLEGKYIPVRHCVEGEKGHRIFGDLEKYAEERGIVFKKSAFGSCELCLYLKENNYECVEFVGLVTNICVLSNAVMARSYMPQAVIKVDAAATASFDDIMHEKALDILQGINVEVINR